MRLEKKWGAKGSPGPATQALSLTGPCVVKEMLPSNVSLHIIFYFKSCIALVTRRGFPLQQQQPCKRYLSAGRARQENRPPARKSSGKARKHGSKVQSGPMQESVSLPGKKLFKTGKKDNQEADRQATEQKTKCSWSSQVAKWLYHSDTMQLCQPNTDSCDLGIKS